MHSAHTKSNTIHHTFTRRHFCQSKQLSHSSKDQYMMISSLLIANNIITKATEASNHVYAWECLWVIPFSLSLFIHLKQRNCRSSLGYIRIVLCTCLFWHLLKNVLNIKLIVPDGITSIKKSYCTFKKMENKLAALLEFASEWKKKENLLKMIFF